MKKLGFTMIEVIFVIVILGILAAVAIPRLAASRNDAAASVIVAELSTCVKFAGGMFLLHQSFDLTIPSCIRVRDTSGTNGTGCYQLTPNNLAGTLIAQDKNGADDVCARSQAITVNSGISSAVGVTHRF